MLRGFNLPAKTPAKMKSFYNGEDVSFVGRPLPLDVAQEHIQNMKKMGMNFVRLCVSWEAVMHAGPNTFDEEYLTYFGKLIDMFEKESIFVDIDPHQDVFSSWTGGDGAPKWTLDLAGLEPENFYDTLAAVTQYEYEKNEKKPINHDVWPTNLGKLGCMTMFTLFWGSHTYAPNLKVEGVSYEEFIQDQYLLFIEKLAERVKHNKNIVCISTMNELSYGYIGNTSLNKIASQVLLLQMPTVLEGFALADGTSLSIPEYYLNLVGFHIKRKVDVNPNKKRAWKGECLWKQHGVWDYDNNGNPKILKPDYFRTPSNLTTSNAFYLPFAKRFYKTIRNVREKTCILLQTQEFIKLPNWDLEKDGDDVLVGRHFYDPILTEFSWFQNMYSVNEETHVPIFGTYFIEKHFKQHIGKMKQLVKSYVGKVPFLLGETGFVMDIKWGFFRRGTSIEKNDYTYVAKGADRMFKAIEANLANVSVWCYDIFNTLKGGDGFNGENFSVYCSDLKNHFRAIRGWARPYPSRTPGKPVSLKYDVSKGVFNYQFTFNKKIEAPLNIAVPKFLLKRGYNVTHSGGEIKEENGVILFTPGPKSPENASIQIQFKSPCKNKS